MKVQTDLQLAPDVVAALGELHGMIASRYPAASFAIQEGFDPPGIYLIATVDVPDTDEVFEVVVDRLVEMQVEEGLPVYVTSLRPIERVMADLQERIASGVPWLQSIG